MTPVISRKLAKVFFSEMRSCNITDSVYRGCTTATTIKRKPKKSADEICKPTKYLSKNQQLLEYMNSSRELKRVLPLIPKSYMKICRTCPPALYFVSQSTASRFADLIADKLTNDCPIIEINPGFGCLTNKLLNKGVKKLILFESSTHYEDSIAKLLNEFPKRIDYRKNDFFSMYKLIFQDGFDAGNRYETLMSGIYIDQESQDTSIQIVGTMSSAAFLKSSMYSLIFNGGVLGRPELFVAVPPSALYVLAPDAITKSSKRDTTLTILFQLLFDYTDLAMLPREHFIPWQTDLSEKKKKNTTLKKLLKMDMEYLVLVHIKLKQNLPCDFTNLPLLWFFLKQHGGNKKSRIIPTLEQWIPGCGIWLITEQDPPYTDAALSPKENDAPLPHMTIFTRFHDLSPQQMLTLFKKFISWPEFKNCPFSDSTDHHRARMLSNSDVEAKYDELYDEEHDDADTE